jgi:RimJ/RimL family protein N-acetyltransferase
VALGKPEVTYWLGKEYRDKGIGITALAKSLCDLKAHPLDARAAKENIASIRVLEKWDFSFYGHDKGFFRARGAENHRTLKLC